MSVRLLGVLGHLVFSLCFFVVVVADAKAQTLEDALTAAYLNNPTLLGQRARLRATDEQVPQALANWRPQVEITGDITRSQTTNSARNFGGKDQIRTPREIALEVTQPLYRGGRTLAATRAAENSVQAERARLSVTEQQILLDAATAYVDVFRDEAVLNLNVNNEQVLKRQLEATRDRFEVGEITRTDVHQAEARLARATAERIEAAGNLDVSRAAYRNVVGEDAPRNLTAPAAPDGQPATLADALKVAAAENPGVTATEYDKKASQDTVDEVRGELLPEVSLNLTVSRGRETNSNTNFSSEEAVGATLTVPIYQQGAVYSRLREAKQVVARDQQAIDEARRNAIEDATRAWESLAAAQAQVTAFKTEVDANVVALEGVVREAQVGSRTVLDVLDAEQELRDARVNHIRAQRDELVALFELRAAVGQLTARAMKLPVPYYDPGAHYNEVRDKWFGTTSRGGTQ